MKAYPLLFALLLIIMSSCKDDSSVVTPNDKDIDLHYSACKGNTIQIADSNKTIISYEYSGGDLKIWHINAGFNCCPGKILVNYTIEGNVITVNEKESKGECDCECLYDLDFVIKNLAPGEYKLVINEQIYRQGAEKLEAIIDISRELSGSFSVIRDYYPWSLPVSQGIDLNYSDCKGTIQVKDSNLTMVNYELTDGDLHIWHINSAFNCCPGKLDVAIDREGNVINIKESEFEAGCRCACLYDLDFYVRDIQAGKYMLKFDEPYFHNQNKKLEFEIDLVNSPTGTYSQERDNYPWGS